MRNILYHPGWTTQLDLTQPTKKGVNQDPTRPNPTREWTRSVSNSDNACDGAIKQISDRMWL